MCLVGLKIFGIQPTGHAGAFARNANDFNVSSAILWIGEGAPADDGA
jgi:hypothetical protein